MTNEDKKPTKKLTCRSVRPGKQFLLCAPGISAESVGAQKIHLQILTMPPRARANAHKHEHHETAIYTLRGKAGLWYGENLAQHFTIETGDLVYIPANMPHLPYNVSDTETYVAVIGRTDPNEQESVVLLPELDHLHA
jgi:uncharacterized RmlC-like cupin family protein